MSVQDAICILEADRQKVFKDDLLLFTDRADAYDLAIQVLEKQIPKIPVGIRVGVNTIVDGCPGCGNALCVKGDYCPNCGQDILWEDA